MKQFLYLFVGGFILYGWYNYSSQYVNEMAIFLPLAIPLGLLFFSLAVVKVNDRPFEFFILNSIRFLFSPKQRKWTTGYNPETVIIMDPLEAKKEEEKIKTESDLDDLAKSLEKQNAELKAKNQQIAPIKASAAAKPERLNLSVSDINSVTTKQQQAQAKPANLPSQPQTPQAAPAPKKGFLSIFK